MPPPQPPSPPDKLQNNNNIPPTTPATENDSTEDYQPSPDEIQAALNLVYHQTDPSYDGAAPSLNNVLQGPYFDDDSLAQLTGGGPIDPYAVNMALRPFNLSLHPLHTHLPDPSITTTRPAFLCSQNGQWFALRRIGRHWLNLNHIMVRPAQIIPSDLDISLRQIRDDGCDIYAVAGSLPPCPADHSPLFNRHFPWRISGRIVHPDNLNPAQFLPTPAANTAYHHALCLGDSLCTDPVCAEYGHRMCDAVDDDDFDDAGYEEAFQDDMQTAIALSIADMQNKQRQVQRQPSFKTSPPTSLISSEGVANTPPGPLRLREGDGPEQR